MLWRVHVSLQVASGVIFVINCTKRTRLITQVLANIRTKLWLMKTTHSDPKRKVVVNEIFWAVVVCRFHTAGSGSTSKTKSVKTLGAELIIKARVVLRQVPSMLLSQMYWIGRQWKEQTKMTVMAQQKEKIPIT